jgi:hypothetical protein
MVAIDMEVRSRSPVQRLAVDSRTGTLIEVGFEMLAPLGAPASRFKLLTPLPPGRFVPSFVVLESLANGNKNF